MLRAGAVLYLTMLLFWTGMTGEGQQSIDLAPADNGRGIFAVVSGNQREAVFTAEREQGIADVYRAVIDGEEITLLVVSVDLYQAADDMIVTRSALEEVSEAYRLPSVLVDDLRAVCELRGEVRVILPKRLAGEWDAEEPLAYYEYGGQRLAKSLCVVMPLENPAPYTIRIGQGKLERVLANMAEALRGLLWPDVVYHTSQGDYVAITLEEHKIRTYIAVWENGNYVPRVKCDDVRWRFAQRAVVNEREQITYTAYEERQAMSVEQMNDAAIAQDGGSGMFVEIVTDYPCEYDGEKVSFASQLPD